MEMYYPGGKFVYIQRVKEIAARFVNVLNDMSAVEAVWNHRLYGPGALNEITQDDVGATEIAPDDLYAFIIMCSQIKNLLNNQPATHGDYIATINRLRADM